MYVLEKNPCRKKSLLEKFILLGSLCHSSVLSDFHGFTVAHKMYRKWSLNSHQIAKNDSRTFWAHVFIVFAIFYEIAFIKEPMGKNFSYKIWPFLTQMPSP